MTKSIYKTQLVLKLCQIHIKMTSTPTETNNASTEPPPAKKQKPLEIGFKASGFANKHRFSQLQFGFPKIILLYSNFGVFSNHLVAFLQPKSQYNAEFDREK